MIVPETSSYYNPKIHGSKRRSRLGVGVAKWEDNQPWYYRNRLADYLESGQTMPDKFVTDFGDVNGKILFKQCYQMQRNGKKALAMRTVESLPEHIRQKIDQRRSWNKENRFVDNILEEFFPSFQFSYATLLPKAYRKGYVDVIVSEKGGARVSDVARSHSIWLDPVDAPKELYKYRLRINRVINWAYKQGYVPIMMTLTMYHRWDNLDSLLDVLREAWKDLLSNYAGRKRATAVDLQGWVRRTEITINDGNTVDSNCADSAKISTPGNTSDNNSRLPNAGWHPHYHAILIIPKDKLQQLSDAEQEWRDAWVESVCKHYEKIVGKKIDKSFLPAFREHGLVFSRVYDSDAKSYGALRPVDDSAYLAKIMGYDPAEVYGGDKEMTSATLKNSKIPFDLIRDSSLPAGDVDLWVEYAFATKGVPAIRFSKGLEDRVNAYFAEHPEQDKSSYNVRPTESVVASLSNDVRQLLYRNFKLDALKQVATKGYDALCSWLKDTFAELGVPQFAELPFAMPRPPI